MSRAAGRLHALDGLRALACLAVFTANFDDGTGVKVSGRLNTPIGVLDAPTFAESGVGVVLFLVMTGAVLSLPFWRQLEHPDRSFDWRTFAFKRAMRIIPPYYACLLALASWTGTWREPGELWPHLLFVNNFWEETLYSVSIQFWTIGVFVQLYVLLPLLFIGIERLTRRRAAAAAIVATVAVATYGLHVMLASRWNTLVVTHSTLAHLPHALMGVLGGAMLVAMQEKPGHARHRVGAELLLLMALVGLLVLSANPAGASLEIPFGRYLLPWMPALMTVAIVTAPLSPVLGRVLGGPPLAWLGVVSYGMYIFHVPVTQFVRRFMVTGPMDSTAEKIVLATTCLAASIAVAAASYVLLERPLIRWVRQRGPA